MADFLLGRGVRLGEWVLIEKLGEGGFGQVWKAENSEVREMLAAVKVPTDPNFVEELRREASLAHDLVHPRIVRTIGLNARHDPPYLVMDFVDGPSLRRVLEGRRTLAPSTALTILLQVLDGLEYAHRRGIVHRDLKPENILLRGWPRDLAPDAPLPAGTAAIDVRLTDFGLGLKPVAAPSLQRSGDTTVTGRLAGTLAYMAPEQRHGEPVDARTDLYAAGLVLHELLTGDATRLRFPLKGVSPYLSDAIERATETDPAERFAGAAEMRVALAAAESLGPATPPERPPVAAIAMAGNGGADRADLTVPAAAVAAAAPSPIVHEALIARRSQIESDIMTLASRRQEAHENSGFGLAEGCGIVALALVALALFGAAFPLMLNPAAGILAFAASFLLFWGMGAAIAHVRNERAFRLRQLDEQIRMLQDKRRQLDEELGRPGATAADRAPAAGR